ncbi:MAG: class II glutamine amidotransferase [Gammaproteobacteria bacterium]|nr:class II glutamine amidotransferase [Gammaproteobacteria bacterium]
MCELFAMSADRPAEVGHYLSRLMPRGGDTGPHADGWGVAYYEGRAARVFKDPTPAAESRLLAMLAEDEVRSQAVIAHIRKANPSIFGRATANTHPFEREFMGRSWVFAHNGKLPGLSGRIVCADSHFRPLGDTDSELAFCYILDAIAREFELDNEPSPDRLVSAITPVVEELAGFGEFNFILGDGECLYVHAHTNLHRLQRTLYMGGETRRMSLLATAPLTGEPWEPLMPGPIRVFRDGREYRSRQTGSTASFPQAA